MKLLKIIATAAFFSSVSLVASAGLYTDPMFSADDVNTSIQCKINNVVMLAKSEVDCNKAGGEVGSEFKK